MILATLSALCTLLPLGPQGPRSVEPPSDPKAVELTGLVAFPSAIELYHARDHKRLVVLAGFADGTTRDVTGETTLAFGDDPPIKIDRQFIVHAVRDGSGSIAVKYGGLRLEIPVAVKASNTVPAVSFENDVIPVLTKSGCNAGTCHGSASGKNGFHLSLFGYDTASDHIELTRELRGRRANTAAPDASLILTKPLREVAHQGGKRLEAGSLQHRLLRDWIRQGATNDAGKAARLTGIAIQPDQVVLAGLGQQQRFIVTASYDDGSSRDVTDLARLSSSNDPVAKPDGAGLVTASERGEAFLMARFGTFAEVVQILVVPDDPGYRFPSEVPAFNYIDEAIYDKMRRLRTAPGARCDDATYLRRVFLDIINQLPTSDEARAFLADADPDKRQKIVDHLLARPEFPDVQAMQWAELLRIESALLERKGMHVYTEYLRDAFRDRVPFDRLVYSLLTAKGSNFRDPAANFYMTQRQPHLMAEDVAQNFLGIRVQCAQCHNHPFERWTMDDYYGFAAFFARVGRKRGEHPYESIIYPRTGGEVRNARDNKVAAPKFLGGAAPTIARDADRRVVLADWLTAKDNPWFATSVANRIWARMFGRGLVDPADDTRVSNPPSHPELYQQLGARLASSGFDLRRLIRDICASRTYQLAPGKAGDTARRTYTEATVRRLTAEQLLDAISQVTGVAERYRNLPRDAKASQVEDGNPRNRFLDIFGRPRRTSACTCDRASEPTLSQALHLINGQTIAQRIRANGGRLSQLLRGKVESTALLDELFLATYCRLPTTVERARLLALVDADPKSRGKAFEDVFWALLNSKEFLFNH